MNQRFFNKMLFGFGLIAIGILFLLNQFGFVHFSLGSIFSTFWPVIIIYIGLSGLLFQSRRRSWPGAFIWNMIVLGAGVVVLLNNLEVTDISFSEIIQYLLPFMLIVFGVGMIVKPSGERDRQEWDDWKRERKKRSRWWKECRDRKDEKGNAAYNDVYKDAYMNDIAGVDEPGHKSYGNDYIHTEWKKNAANRSSFIGDIYLGQEYWELTPLNISHFIGDTVIDLTKASIPFGETRICVSAFIGDVKLLAPNDFDVEVRVEASSFMGDMNVLDRRESGMMRSISTQSPQYMDAGKKIHLVVSMFIGDIVVKRVG